MQIDADKVNNCSVNLVGANRPKGSRINLGGSRRQQKDAKMNMGRQIDAKMVDKPRKKLVGRWKAMG